MGNKAGKKLYRIGRKGHPKPGPWDGSYIIDAFEMAVGKGKMLVSALNHTGQTNSVGQWLFSEFQKQLLTEHSDRDDMAAEATLKRLTEEVNRRELLLHQSEWEFHPDPNEIGIQEKWFATDFDDREWGSIRVDQQREPRRDPDE